MEKECLFCKKNFYIRKSRQKRAKYCSIDCLRNDKRITKICIICNKEFRIKKHRFKQIYCSSICQGIFNRNRVKIHCIFCNKLFEVKKCQENKSKYCSIKCKGCDRVGKYTGSNSPSWQGGKTSINKSIRNSTEYLAWRLYIYRRDNYLCALCNQAGGQLNAHHIQKFGNNKDLAIDKKNGITLCERCHRDYVNWNEYEYEDYFNLLIIGREN